MLLATDNSILLHSAEMAVLFTAMKQAGSETAEAVGECSLNANYDMASPFGFPSAALFLQSTCAKTA